MCSECRLRYFVSIRVLAQKDRAGGNSNMILAPVSSEDGCIAYYAATEWRISTAARSVVFAICRLICYASPALCLVSGLGHIDWRDPQTRLHCRINFSPTGRELRLAGRQYESVPHKVHGSDY